MRLSEFRKFVKDLKLKAPYRVNTSNTDMLFFTVYNLVQKQTQSSNGAAGDSEGKPKSSIEKSSNALPGQMNKMEMNYIGFGIVVRRLAHMRYAALDEETALSNFGANYLFANCKISTETDENAGPRLLSMMELQTQNRMGIDAGAQIRTKFGNFLELCAGNMESALASKVDMRKLVVGREERGDQEEGKEEEEAEEGCAEETEMEPALGESQPGQQERCPCCALPTIPDWLLTISCGFCACMLLGAGIGIAAGGGANGGLLGGLIGAIIGGIIGVVIHRAGGLSTIMNRLFKKLKEFANSSQTLWSSIPDDIDSEIDRLLRENQALYQQERDDWDVVAAAMVSSLEASIEMSDPRAGLSSDVEAIHHLPVDWNSANLMALLDLVIECYTLCSFAFQKPALEHWGMGDNALEIFSTAMEAPLLLFSADGNSTHATPNQDSLDAAAADPESSSFRPIFWFCVGCAVVYPMYSTTAVKEALEGEFGNKDPPSACKEPKRWLYLQGLGLLGSSLFQMIMSSLLASFVCDYGASDGGSTGVLQRDPSITCWAGEHWLMVFCAVASGVVYYPISTFMYPYLQFQDKGLDLKYDPSFLVLTYQAKLFLSGLAAWFAEGSNSATTGSNNGSSLLVMLVVSCVECFMLAFLCWKMQPCLVRRVSHWRATSFAAAGWACLVSLFVCLTAPCANCKWYGLALLLAGWVALLSRLRLRQSPSSGMGMSNRGDGCGSGGSSPLV
jgi:hypothetical protein